MRHQIAAAYAITEKQLSESAGVTHGGSRALELVLLAAAVLLPGGVAPFGAAAPAGAAIPAGPGPVAAAAVAAAPSALQLLFKDTKNSCSCSKSVRFSSSFRSIFLHATRSRRTHPAWRHRRGRRLTSASTNSPPCTPRTGRRSRAKERGSSDARSLKTFEAMAPFRLS